MITFTVNVEIQYRQRKGGGRGRTNWSEKVYSTSGGVALRRGINLAFDDLHQDVGRKIDATCIIFIHATSEVLAALSASELVDALITASDLFQSNVIRRDQFWLVREAVEKRLG